MIYRGQGFLAVVAHYPHPPPPPPPRQQDVFVSQSSCVSRVDRLLRGGMGEEPNHNDDEKAWPSINHSVLFVPSRYGRKRASQSQKNWPDPNDQNRSLCGYQLAEAGKGGGCWGGMWIINPILHTVWLNNHALTLKRNTAKYYFGEKSSFCIPF